VIRSGNTNQLSRVPLKGEGVMIRFAQDLCSNLEESLRREWLETNGIGDFASSTLSGVNTRRYHGLLVAATKPSVGRYVLLSKLEETLVINGRQFDLCTNCYPGAIHPQGFRYLKQFRLDPFPVLTFDVEGIEIGGCPVGTSSVDRLPRLPQPAGRTAVSTAVSISVPGPSASRPIPGLPALHLANDARDVESAGHWYRNFLYDVECERGLDCHEDLFNPCVLRFDLNSQRQATVIASTEGGV
jgi:hypothetical protein